MRTVTHPALGQVELPDLLHALSDPVRLNIVRCLARDGECACGSFSVSVSKSTLSHHLKVLRQAGLTQTRPDGTLRLISLRRVELDERFPELLESVLSCR
ncbi:MAG: helix-turn-helix transcriptional regulator [Thermoleophilaceae bacterium]|nr:helix-turn-helix transcriptional regulator [Thermoleophilaceae bacterium]